MARFTFDLKKFVNIFTNAKREFFVVLFNFIDGPKYFHVMKNEKGFNFQSSHLIKSVTKQTTVADAIQRIYSGFKGTFKYTGVIDKPYEFGLFPLEDLGYKDIDKSYLPFADITVARDILKGYTIGDYLRGETLKPPVVDRLILDKNGWNDDEVLMNDFFKAKTSGFVMPKFYDRFLLVYRYLTKGAFILEGNFGVGKSYGVEALSNLDKRLASTTVLSSQREGDLLGKISILKNGNPGLLLSEIVSSLKKGHTVSVEEPNVNEYVQSLRQLFDGKGYVDIGGERTFIDPQGIAVFSINSRRFIGPTDKVTKDLDNRFASRVAYSISVPNLTKEDIVNRLLAVHKPSYDWDTYKKDIYYPNRNIRYFEGSYETFINEVTDFLLAMQRDEFSGKYASYFQPGLVSDYISKVAAVHDLKFEELNDLFVMSTLNKIRWNYINEAVMSRTEADIMNSLNWKRKLDYIWQVYPFKYIEPVKVEEVKMFGDDIDSVVVQPVQPVQPVNTPPVDGRRGKWSELSKGSLEDEAQAAL